MCQQNRRLTNEKIAEIPINRHTYYKLRCSLNYIDHFLHRGRLIGQSPQEESNLLERDGESLIRRNLHRELGQVLRTELQHKWVTSNQERRKEVE